MTSAIPLRAIEQEIADFNRYFHEALVRLTRQEELVRALAQKGRNTRRAADRLSFLEEIFGAIKGRYETLLDEYRSQHALPVSSPPKARNHHSPALNVLVAITDLSRSSIPQYL